jgi:hypothetical protein
MPPGTRTLRASFLQLGADDGILKSMTLRIQTPRRRAGTLHADTPFLLTVARWRVLSALFLFSACPGTAQTGDGLLGVLWGTSLEVMQGRFALALADSDSVWSRYHCALNSIGGAEVEECLLEFRGGAFAGAAVLTHGEKDSRRLLAHLLRVFGKGKREDARAYQWLSPTTHLFYDEDSAGDGYVYWYSPEFAGALADEGDRRMPQSRNTR